MTGEVDSNALNLISKQKLLTIYSELDPKNELCSNNFWVELVTKSVQLKKLQLKRESNRMDNRIKKKSFKQQLSWRKLYQKR